MRRHESFPPGHPIEVSLGPLERSNSAGVCFSPLKLSGRLASLVVAIGTLAILAEMLTERGLHPSPLEAQIWVARAADCGTVDTVLFSRDGQSLASLDSNGRAFLWDVATGRQSDEQPEGFDGLRALGFAPDGTILAGGKLDSTIVLWDLKSRKVQAKLPTYTSPVNGLAFSPDGAACWPRLPAMGLWFSGKQRPTIRRSTNSVRRPALVGSRARQTEPAWQSRTATAK